MEAHQVIEFILEKESPQEQLHNLGDFQTFAKERGIDLSGLERENFEQWDHCGLLRPVIKVRSNLSYHLVVAHLQHALRYDPAPLGRRPRKGEDALPIYSPWHPFKADAFTELRRERNKRVIDPYSKRFQDWENFRDGDGFTCVTYWYHPFQIIRLRELMRACGLSEIPRGTKYRIPAKVKRTLQQSEAHFLRLQTLVVAIEDRYLPRIRHPNPNLGGIIGLEATKNDFNCANVLSRSGLSVKDVEDLHWDLAWEWNELNDLGQWHALIRHADHNSRHELRNRPLLAWSYYEWAKMSELFLTELTGKPPLPVEKIVTIGASHSFLSLEIEQEEPNPVPFLLREFGLDPRVKADLFVEGETELSFIRVWCEQHGIHLLRRGIALFDYHGTGGLRNEIFRDCLKRAKNENRLVFVTVDDENKAPDDLKELEIEGLIVGIYEHSSQVLMDPRQFRAGAFLWKPCFEDANFTPEQLVEVHIETLATREQQNLSLPAPDAILGHMKRLYSTRAQSKWIKALELVEKKRLKKPLLGKELARRFKGADLPIIQLIKKILVHV